MWIVNTMDAFCWIVIAYCIYLTLNVNGQCLYGTPPDCYFPCNCAMQTECEQGICPSGCESNTGIYNIPWRGPACQIGNVAFRKSCEHRGNTVYPANLAVDGRPQTDVSTATHDRSHAYCSHQRVHGSPDNDPTDPAWWVVDLGAVHKVYNVTIYGRIACDSANPRCAERLSNFSIRVGFRNTYTDGPECGRYDGPHVPLVGHVTVPCTTPRVGTHVYFVRTGGFQVGVCSLCEVIVIGHRYVDCSSVECHSESCDDITGCDSCRGSYRPDCRQECDPGYFGVNCGEVCGNCGDDAPCDRVDGACPGDCQIWWIGDKCDTYIVSPVVTNERASVETTTNESVVLEWEPLSSIPSELAEFYKYRVNFRESAGHLQDGPFFPHRPSTLSHTFTNLAHNTVYEFTVVTYRAVAGTEEAGGSYTIVSAETKCKEPSLQRVSIVAGAGGNQDLGGIMIIHDQIDSGCDEVTLLWLAFKHNSDREFTRITRDPSAASSTIIPGRSGQYTVKIIAVNNEGLSATSPPQTVAVIETRSDPPTAARTGTTAAPGSETTSSSDACSTIIVPGKTFARPQIKPSRDPLGMSQWSRECSQCSKGKASTRQWGWRHWTRDLPRNRMKYYVNTECGWRYPILPAPRNDYCGPYPWNTFSGKDIRIVWCPLKIKLYIEDLD